jgi:hypothetical protein
MDAVADKLLSTLRRLSPARVRAYTSDDDARDIAVPTRRRKWAQVIEAIESRSWTRCELLDKSGAVLGYVENTEPARELESLAEGPESRSITMAERIVGLVVKAQRDAMTFRDAEVTSLLKAQGDVVRELTSSMRALSDIYRAQVDAASEVASLQATAAAGGDSQLKELLDAAPQILQVLPLVKGMMGGGTKPNGRKVA